jgi:hypothetical protein
MLQSLEGNVPDWSVRVSFRSVNMIESKVMSQFEANFFMGSTDVRLNFYFYNEECFLELHNEHF